MKILTHKFVDFIPEKLDEQVLYISLTYKTAIHKCCCGCGKEVVTPISPTDWKIIYDGETISIYPSIGNWSFDCKSHYWIENNRVKWANKWSREEIDEGRKYDRNAKKVYFSSKNDEEAYQKDNRKVSVFLWIQTFGDKIKKLLFK